MLSDCGSTWELMKYEPPLLAQGYQNKDLGFQGEKSLGKHSLCVVSDRGLKTGKTKTGWFSGYKKKAQRANFKCAVTGPSATGEWKLEVDAEKKQGKNGKFSCEAFCI